MGKNTLVGDGTTNDATALNTLITSIGSTNTDLYFPRGTYKISTNVVLPSNVRLCFAIGAMLKVANGYSVTGTNTKIDVGLWQCFDLSLGGTIAGTWDIREVCPEWFGAVANDESDCTFAIQSAMNLCVMIGSDLSFSNGIYKTTSPITVERISLDIFYTPKITGVGVCFGGSVSCASTIKGYNIPSKRAVLEILGSGNGKTVSPYIENIGIIQDLDTCDPMSFCTFLGDSRQMFVNRVYMYGYNGNLLRCGTKTGSVDYASICLKFTQVQIDLPFYYNWSGNIVDEKYKYGWAFLHEIAFSNNSGASVMDNVEFNSCLFGGSVFVYTAITVFKNCMWYIPGFYKSALALTDSNYATKMATKTFDFDNAIWIAGGTVKIESCYFEDVPKCIYINTINGYTSRVDVSNSHFNGRSNLPSTGDKYLSDYIIFIDSYGGGVLSFENNNMSDGPDGTPWYTYTIKNNINRYHIIAKNNSCVNFLISDTSWQGAILDINMVMNSHHNWNSNINLIFNRFNLVVNSLGKLSVSDLSKYKIPVYCTLKHIDIYTDAKMISEWYVIIEVNGSNRYAFLLKDPTVSNTYCDEIYTESGKNGVRYSFDTFLNDPMYVGASKVNYFLPDDLIGIKVGQSANSLSADNAINCSAELTFTYG